MVILFISLFVALCVKLDPGTHKYMHLVLALKLGVTFPHRVLESSNSLHCLLCLVSPITNIPLKGVIPVGVPRKSEGSFSIAELGRTMSVVRTTAPLVL
jgi:hypothetical protein